MGNRENNEFLRVLELHDLLNERGHELPLRPRRQAEPLHENFTYQENVIIVDFMVLREWINRHQGMAMWKALKTQHFSERDDVTAEVLSSYAKKICRPCRELLLWQAVTRRPDDLAVDTEHPDYPYFEKIQRYLKYYVLKSHENRPGTPFVAPVLPEQ